MAIALVVSACSEHLPLGAHAARIQQQSCPDGYLAGQQERTLQTMRVTKVEGKYHADTCSGTQQIFGVRLWVVPAAPISAHEVAVAFLCHAARAHAIPLDAALLATDPYVLPDAWVDADVEPAGDGLLVTLTGESVADNIRLLKRAEAVTTSRAASTPHNK